MAQFKQIKPPKPVEVDKFLGVNESVGETEIKLGEAVIQENFRITKNYKPQKRPGHHTFINCASGQIRGMWYGDLNGERLIFAYGGTLYSYDLTRTTTETDLDKLITGVWEDVAIWDDTETWDESASPIVTSIGSITDADTIFIWFQSKVYIKAGSDYKTFDGTTLADVVPYVPTVAIGSPPLGGGTLFESVNLLTGTKTQQFIGDGTTLYQLPETNIDADLVTCTVDGVTKVEVTDFTVNRPLGQVTFLVAPVAEAVVALTWTKVEAGNADLALNHTNWIDYGVENDTNLFLFGNPNEKNTFRYSMVAKPNYFPVDAFVNVASDEFAITDLVPQYGSLLVFKQNTTKIVKPRINVNYSSNTGLNPYDFPYFDLNNAVGNIAPKMVQLIENNPVSLDGYSMWLWSSSTGVEDERNAKIISDRLKLSLQELDLSQAVTFDYQNEKELWVNVGNKVYIWNYGNDTMYTYTNINSQQFLDVEGKIYYRDSFKIERFDNSYKADTETLGDTIPCTLYLGFSDINSLNYKKIMRDEWVAINPASKTSVDVTFITDRKNEADSKSYSIKYNLLDFNSIDFNAFSFLTNRNPQPKHIRGKVKKFVYIQVKFENNTNNEELTILKLLMQMQAQGLSR